MSTQRLDMSSREYQEKFYANMVKGVWYHLPLSEANNIFTHSDSNPNFSYVLREVSREGNDINVMKIRDKQELANITESVIRLAEMEQFLEGPRIR